MNRCYWRFAPKYYRWKILQRLDHDAPLDPLKVIWVDPDQISKVSGRKHCIRNRHKSLGRVQGGDWDLEPAGRATNPREDLETVASVERFEETLLHRSFTAHFDDGVNWEQTDLYQRYRASLEDGMSIGQLHTKDDLSEYFRDIDTLYEIIAEKGYTTQLKLFKNQPSGKHVGYLDLLTDEITVDIGRTGELLFVDGRHRLCIAKILGLETIPIVFLARHRHWMDRRESLYQNGISSNYIGHPDLIEFDQN